MFLKLCQFNNNGAIMKKCKLYFLADVMEHMYIKLTYNESSTKYY